MSQQGMYAVTLGERASTSLWETLQVRFNEQQMQMTLDDVQHATVGSTRRVRCSDFVLVSIIADYCHCHYTLLCRQNVRSVLSWVD